MGRWGDGENNFSANCHLSTVNCQLSTVNCQLSTVTNPKYLNLAI
ncbi:hypothetical protein [Nostoc linckia]|nr:hypothetical protein [Nostoc linckia]